MKVAKKIGIGVVCGILALILLVPAFAFAAGDTRGGYTEADAASANADSSSVRPIEKAVEKQVGNTTNGLASADSARNAEAQPLVVKEEARMGNREYYSGAHFEGNSYFDANGDGVCDFFDANGDGICDNYDNCRGHGYLDENGDGVCDNYGDNCGAGQGNGDGFGQGSRYDNAGNRGWCGNGGMGRGRHHR